jgi:uncharacterized protein
MQENIRYLTDASLAKLAKWLRLIGYDTVVFPNEAGRDLLNQAYAEKRIVLTKRHDMRERQFSGELFSIAGLDIESQLKEVIDKFSLTLDKQKMFRICLKCNAGLYPVAKEDVAGLVPPYVFANCDEYNQCPHCRNIYWPGTHEQNALQFLRTLGINQR